MTKMNVTDFLDGGVTSEDALTTAWMLDQAGIDAIELSGDTGWGMRVLGDMNRTSMRTVQEEAYYQTMAQRMKKTIKAPLSSPAVFDPLKSLINSSKTASLITLVSVVPSYGNPTS